MGLGSPTAMYLAAAGIGTLGIVDGDTVDMSNLQRQLLHTEATVGKPKVDSARATLSGINSDIQIKTYPFRIDSSNVMELFSEYDIIVDGCDNFSTRYLVNDACYFLNKVNVHGSIFRFDGQVTVFKPHVGPCYRCLYPEPPPAAMAPSCAEAGVLGVLPGIIGVAQAIETIKVILGIGQPLIGRLLTFDALPMKFRELRTRRDPECPLCGTHPTVTGLIDYDFFAPWSADAVNLIYVNESYIKWIAEVNRLALQSHAERSVYPVGHVRGECQNFRSSSAAAVDNRQRVVLR